MSRRFQLFGFHQCFDSVDDEVGFLISAPWFFTLIRSVGESRRLEYRQLESFRDVADDTGNLERLWFAGRQDGLIDQVRRHVILPAK